MGKFSIKVRSVLAGVIVFVLLLWHFVRVLGMDFIAAAIFGLIIAVAIALIIGIVSFFQRQKRVLEEQKERNLRYEEEVTALYSKVVEDVRTIRKYIPQIENMKMREMLEEICCHTGVILVKIDEHRPLEKQVSAAGLLVYLERLVDKILPQYIEMQTPAMHKYFPDWETQLSNALISTTNLEEYFRGTVRLLESGDMNAFEIAVIMIDPFQRSFPV